MIKTTNFHPESDPKLLCTCGHPKCDKRSVDQPTLDRTQRVRDMVNRGMTVNSGGRCQYHPNEVHRKVPADHQKCKGIDIAIAGGLQRGEIVNAGIACGFNAIGVAKTFIHLGYRAELEPGDIMMWTY